MSPPSPAPPPRPSERVVGYTIMTLSDDNMTTGDGFTRLLNFIATISFDIYKSIMYMN